jgi:hypothetical protein
MRRLICAMGLALVASPALGQDVGEETGTGRGRELIAAAHAEGVFELLPAEDQIVVRHSRSGLVCRLDPDNGNRLVIFPQAARGEDVACDTTDGRESATLYATRFSFDTSLDEQIDGAETAVRRRFPDAIPFAQSFEIASDTLPAHRTRQFLVTRQDGARMYTRASVAFVGEWVIKLRYSVLAADDEAARQGEAASNEIWTAALAEFGSQRP